MEGFIVKTIGVSDGTFLSWINREHVIAAYLRRLNPLSEVLSAAS